MQLVHTEEVTGSIPVSPTDVSPGQRLIRRTREETGITCEITGLVGIYTSPHQVSRYTSNGEVRQEFSVVFTARPVGGKLRPSSESSEPQWVYPEEISGLQMHPSMRQRIQHYLDKRREPYLG